MMSSSSSTTRIFWVIPSFRPRASVLEGFVCGGHELRKRQCELRREADFLGYAPILGHRPTNSSQARGQDHDSSPSGRSQYLAWPTPQRVTRPAPGNQSRTGQTGGRRSGAGVKSAPRPTTGTHSSPPGPGDRKWGSGGGGRGGKGALGGPEAGARE